MSYRVEITIPGAGKNWHMQQVQDITQWKLYNTVGKYNTWWKGSVHKERMESDIMVIDFAEEQDAVAFKLVYVCNNTGT